MQKLVLFSGIGDQVSRLETAIRIAETKSRSKSNHSKANATTTPNLAIPLDQGSQFLSVLNEVIGQLRAKKPVDPQTLGTLVGICKDPKFDLKMNLGGRDTPLSLILDKLAIHTNNSDNCVIELLKAVLKAIPNLHILLADPIHNGNTSPTEYAIDIVHPNLIRLRNWLLENGANNRKVNNELYSSDINIAKLRCLLHVFAYPSAPNYKVKEPELKSNFKALFIQSLVNQERYNFKIERDDKKFLDSTDDAVSLLFSSVHRLTNDFILELLQIAKAQGYDFKAYGRDYGVGNLLYHCLRDVYHPPSIKTIRFLLEQGLKPKSTVSRIPDDYNPDREVSCYKEEALKIIPTRDRNPASPISLVEKHRATANGAQKGAWTKIYNHFQTVS